MASGKTLLAAGILVRWMFCVALVMILARLINIEIFFVLWLIGALIITEFISLSTLRPKWRTYQLVMLGTGVGIFGIIILMKVIDIILLNANRFFHLSLRDLHLFSLL